MRDARLGQNTVKVPEWLNKTVSQPPASHH
jgi:hypothetical protein